jgi:hypothetical protein
MPGTSRTPGNSASSSRVNLETWLRAEISGDWRSSDDAAIGLNEAANKTALLKGSINSLKCAKKSEPNMGLSTAANTKEKLNLWPENNKFKSRTPQVFIRFPSSANNGGPFAGLTETKGNTLREAPVSIKKLLCAQSSNK